jgi:hypothetical protein
MILSRTRPSIYLPVCVAVCECRGGTLMLTATDQVTRSLCVFVFAGGLVSLCKLVLYVELRKSEQRILTLLVIS